MRPPTGSQIQRWADLAIPPLVAIFLVLVAGDESPPADEEFAVVIAMALGIVQGAALAWRRNHPERAMAVALVGGFATPSSPRSWGRSGSASERSCATSRPRSSRC